MAYNPYFQQYPYMGAVPDMMGQFKSPYQMPKQMPPQQQTQPQGPSADIIWVQGEAGAKSYLVAPNSTVMLMDSEANTFYFKSTDASGMPQPLRVFDYTERTVQPKPQTEHVCQCAGKYASAEAVQAMADEIAELKRKIEQLTVQ